MNLRLVAAAFGISCIAFAGMPQAQDAPVLETVAYLPSNGFNENIVQGPEGSFYVTGAFESTLWKITADGKAERFASFPDHEVVLGVTTIPGGFTVGAFKRRFTTPSGMDFSDVGSEVVVLDSKGRITGSVAGQKGNVFNGMTTDGRGRVLISDSQASTIWLFDPKEETLTLWIEDRALAPASRNALGANGIKVVNGWVYVANKSDMAIYKVKMDAEGNPEGDFILVANELPAADDFAVGPDGTIYIPPADQNQPVTVVAPGGAKSVLIEQAPYGSSAIVSADGRWLYWATGRDFGHQRLVRVAIP